MVGSDDHLDTIEKSRVGSNDLAVCFLHIYRGMERGARVGVGKVPPLFDSTFDPFCLPFYLILLACNSIARPFDSVSLFVR